MNLGRPAEIAWERARTAVEGRRIEALARPIFEGMIEQCRQEVGLACFATSGDNELLWERYGGQGNGVCVEIEAPNELLQTHLHPVEYLAYKRLHIDQLLASHGDPSSVKAVYTVALLSKSQLWAPESEVRFVSRRQNVAVQLAGSRISRIILGPYLTSGISARINSFVNSLPYALPTSKREA